MRAFLAIPLPQALIDAIGARVEPLKPKAPDARWARPANLHLTLRFWGELAEGKVPGMETQLSQVTGRAAPFELALGSIGTFGKPSRPRVLYVGLAGDTNGLHRFEESVSLALEPLGLQRGEQEFTPHLTLARARWGQGDRDLGLLRKSGTEPWSERFTVRELVLFESELRTGGPLHTHRFTLPLQG